jgi:hypothetical protein
MIVIRLRYRDDEMIVLPINPEHLEITKGSESEVAKVVGLGNITIPQSPEPANITISSFFWQQWLEEYRTQYLKVAQYVTWFKKWQKSGIPAKFTIVDKRIGAPYRYVYFVTCDGFNYDLRAGEEDDVYYELQLKEYPKYGAKVIKPKITETPTIGIVAEPPPPERIDNKPAVLPTYRVKPGDSLISIAKQLSNQGGDNWRELYNIPENRNLIGKNPAVLNVGDEFIVPQSWVTH